MGCTMKYAESYITDLDSRNDIQSKARALIDAALEGGGKNNIAIVLSEV